MRTCVILLGFLVRLGFKIKITMSEIGEDYTEMVCICCGKWIDKNLMECYICNYSYAKCRYHSKSHSLRSAYFYRDKLCKHRQMALSLIPLPHTPLPLLKKYLSHLS